MKIAIMQPYFFPYLAYWQLIHSVDKFVIYDDVNYIKGGWINRNRILINGKPSYITLPLKKLSPNKKICDISLQKSDHWRKKLLKKIDVTYRRSPYFHDVYPLIEEVVCYDKESLVEFLIYQLEKLIQYLEMEIDLIPTSRLYKNSHLSGQTRVLDICKYENADTYINLIGGKQLYNNDDFYYENIKIYFICMNRINYKQRTKGFIPNLSIIDGLMELGPSRIKKLLHKYYLIN